MLYTLINLQWLLLIITIRMQWSSRYLSNHPRRFPTQYKWKRNNHPWKENGLIRQSSKFLFCNAQGLMTIGIGKSVKDRIKGLCLSFLCLFDGFPRPKICKVICVVLGIYCVWLCMLQMCRSHWEGSWTLLILLRSIRDESQRLGKERERNITLCSPWSHTNFCVTERSESVTSWKVQPI